MMKQDSISLQVARVEAYVKELLPSFLPGHLFYHNLDHTLDVVRAAILLLEEEAMDTAHNRLILQTAALFHDTGFIHVYINHEDESCLLARQTLPGLGYTPEEIETIESLIMKTKMSSPPESMLEKILCDADLDYLGRDDFYVTGKKLFNEWLAIGKVRDENEWNRLQVKFLESHQYWTGSAQLKREMNKQKHLLQLKEMQGIKKA